MQLRSTVRSVLNGPSHGLPFGNCPFNWPRGHSPRPEQKTVLCAYLRVAHWRSRRGEGGLKSSHFAGLKPDVLFALPVFVDGRLRGMSEDVVAR